MKTLYFNSTFGALTLSSYLSGRHDDSLRFSGLSFDKEAIARGLRDPDSIYCLSIGSLGDIRMVENLFFMVRNSKEQPVGFPKFILGGPAFSSIDCDRLLKEFPEISYIVVGEGYQALEQCLISKPTERVIRGDDYDKVRRVDLNRSYPWHVERPIPVSMGEIACSWGRCRFCHHLDAESPARMSVEEFCKQLIDYHYQYGWKSFYIYDNHLDPDELAAILEYLKSNKITLNLDVFGMRLKKNFIPLAKLMRETGMVRFIGWGLECYSQNVLNLYRKGTKLSIIPDILQAAVDGGAKSIVYILLGLPGCEAEDYQATYRFLKQNIKKTGMIHQVLISWFLLSSQIVDKMSCDRIQFQLKNHYSLNEYFGNHDELPGVETIFKDFNHRDMQSGKWVSRDSLFLNHREILSKFLSLPATAYDYRGFFLKNDTWRKTWGGHLNQWLKNHAPAVGRMKTEQLLQGIRGLSKRYQQKKTASG